MMMRPSSISFLLAVLGLALATCGVVVKADEILADCSTETLNVFTCIALNENCTEACDNVEVDDSANPTDCKGLNDMLCPTFGCCAACVAQAEALGECAAGVYGVTCDFDCSGASSMATLFSVVATIIGVAHLTMVG